MTSMPQQIMVIAGEPSGDRLAAELVCALRDQVASEGSMAPQFFGAGGPRMAGAGVELAVDMTAYAVVGLWEVARHYFTFLRIFYQLLHLAEKRRPAAVVCVDFSGFNRRFAHALKLRARQSRSLDWQPRLVQFVSPQVWASRPGRAGALAKDFDLVLSILPFEKAWYQKHEPGLRVEFVGHPVLDRYGPAPADKPMNLDQPRLLLLPGSRIAELQRHMEPLLGAWRIIRERCPAATAAMVLPDEKLRALASQWEIPPGLALQAGGLDEQLRQATVAVASTGTVTVECAYFGVPTVALYKTSWLTYQVARRIVTVPYLAMPNLLANAPVFPEFIQGNATAHKLAEAVLEWLRQPEKYDATRRRLREITATLGPGGAAARAAQHVRELAGL